MSIPRSEDPQFPIPGFVIVAIHPGASPTDVEELVAAWWIGPRGDGCKACVMLCWTTVAGQRPAHQRRGRSIATGRIAPSRLGRVRCMRLLGGGSRALGPAEGRMQGRYRKCAGIGSGTMRTAGIAL